MNSVAYPLHNLSKIHHLGFATLYKNSLTNQKSLHAAIHLDPGAVFATFESAEVLPEANRFTVQLSDHQHVILSPEFLQYINHSCNPSIFFDTEKMEIRSLRSIVPGDELSFFYPSTEWHMAEPFHCFCNANNCLHTIQGAAFLTQEAFGSYELTNFIRQKLNTSHLQKV